MKAIALAALTACCLSAGGWSPAQAQNAAAAEQAFKQLDGDGNGALSAQELSVMAQGRSDGDARIALLIVMLDADGSGDLSVEEFVVMMAGNQGRITDAQSRRLFDHFDVNGDGGINKSEGRAAMQQMSTGMSAADMEAAMEQADSNGDGVISFEEFRKIPPS
ncbi:MAG: hypothetical protein Kilf2KO_12460 [Rhodospirillales bacterium]